MIDVVGHFGSRFSYATVGAQVCRALEAAGRLGNVTNIDESWLDDYADIQSATSRQTGQHLLLMVDAQEWIYEAYARKYNPKCIAIFSSPNTDRLDRERAIVAGNVGLVLVPSRWCERSVQNSMKFVSEPLVVPWITRVPLGVSPRFMEVPRNRKRAERIRFVHLATDFAWPGRKGTEELLAAWGRAQKAINDRAELRVHVPMEVYESAHYAVADLDLENVTVEIGQERGSTEDDLARIYEETDVLVQPSRCEGFGLMILAACVSQTPLVTTYATGHVDFLSEMHGWLGVATCDRYSTLVLEEGSAPVVEPDVLAPILVSAACSPVLDFLHEKAARNEERAMQWCWEYAMGDWIDILERWRRSTT